MRRTSHGNHHTSKSIEREKAQQATKVIRDVENELYKLELEKTPLRLFKIKNKQKDKQMKVKTVPKLESIKTAIIVGLMVGIIAFICGMHYEAKKINQIKSDVSSIVGILKSEAESTVKK